jgi:hypothetical protein
MDPYGRLEGEDATPIDLSELLTRWPRSVPERIDRTLCNLARLSQTAGHKLDLLAMETSYGFARSREEFNFHIRALITSSFLEVRVAHGDVIAQVVVSPSGWVEYERLTRGASSRENPAFVAMWFGGEDQKSAMDRAYLEGISPAIEAAGYRATRVDLVEHNDWIMDRVLGDIRLAPFVVADFTAHRNGVYLEAGFARGLGRPVINTCREDELKNAHFDTAQLNHVRWRTPEELREKLYHRILGSIGRGAHAPPAGKS